METYVSLRLACTLVLAVASRTIRCENDNKQPNILLVVADDLGYHDIGYHGSDISTPHLDALAYGGVRLENYYTLQVCTPSRAALLSGRYPIHTGLQHRIVFQSTANGLPLDSPTVADKLREAGYATHMIGKWHVGHAKKEYTPTYRGFDTFFGYLCGSQDYYTHRSCMNEMCGYDLYNNTKPASIKHVKTQYSTDLYTQKTVDIINNHSGSKPLFLYVAFQAVHGPFFALDHVDEYEQRNAYITDTKRRLFAGMVTRMDEAVKNITTAMKDKGLWDNTILVFTTDNGGKRGYGCNWPLRGSKGSIFEGGIRGVGFVHSKLLPTSVVGSVSGELIHITDWFPTFVHLAGGTLSGTKPLDGLDQWNSIKYGRPGPRIEMLINIDPLRPKGGQPIFHDKFDTSMHAGLRIGDWKIVTGLAGLKAYWSPPPYMELRKLIRINEAFPNNTDTKNLWLFNITADPVEKFDLSEEYPDVVSAMLARLSYYYEGSVPVQPQDNDPRSNPALNGGYWGPWL